MPFPFGGTALDYFNFQHDENLSSLWKRRFAPDQNKSTMTDAETNALARRPRGPWQHPRLIGFENNQTSLFVRSKKSPVCRGAPG
jgi:hypothetical protein